MALTQEQKEARRQGLGGSDAAAALGLHPYKSPLVLYLEKVGEIEEPDLSGNESIYWGEVLEGALADRWSQDTGQELRRMAKTYQHAELPYLLGHVDRKLTAAKEGWEGKTANSRLSHEWGPPGEVCAGSGAFVPEHYYIQVQHYLAVTGWERWHLSALIGGQDYRAYVVRPDEELLATMLPLLGEFWQRVQERRPPEPRDLEDVARRWPRNVLASTVATPEALEALLQLGPVRGQLEALEARKAALELVVKSAMGEAGQLLDTAGRSLATWKVERRSTLDAKALAEEHPELAKQYAREHEPRVFRPNWRAVSA